MESRQLPSLKVNARKFSLDCPKNQKVEISLSIRKENLRKSNELIIGGRFSSFPRSVLIVHQKINSESNCSAQHRSLSISITPESGKIHF